MGLKLQEKWKNIALRLKIEIVSPYTLKMGDGEQLRIDVLLPEFGDQNGMLLVASYEEISPYVEELIKLGFGYSTLSEPSDNIAFSMKDIVDVLRDWEWTGRDDQRPEWLDETEFREDSI